MNQQLGQFEFIDPGYGYEIAMADMGMGISDFGWDTAADYASGWDWGMIDSAGDWGALPDTWGADTQIDWGAADPTGGADPYAGAYPLQDVSPQSIQNIEQGTTGSGSLIPTGAGFNMNEVLGLMKTGLSFYQAFSQIQAKNEAISKGLAPASGAQSSASAPAGYTRLPDGSLRNNTTGQVIRPTGAPGAPGAPGAELIPGVPNWALLAGGAAAVYFLMK